MSDEMSLPRDMSLLLGELCASVWLIEFTLHNSMGLIAVLI